MAKPMLSAKAQSFELTKALFAEYLRIMGSSANANKVPDNGHPCLMPNGIARSATVSTAKSTAVTIERLNQAPQRNGDSHAP